MGSLIFIIGLTIDTLGKVILGLLVILVHNKIIKEHKIDKKVLSEMKTEKTFGFIGIILILIGYAMQVISF